MSMLEIVMLSCIFLAMPAFLILAVQVDEKNRNQERTLNELEGLL